MHQPKSNMIDVIIPAFNAHKFIHKPLASLKKQTIRDKLLITIIDDGSNETYIKIIEQYQKYLKINLIKLKRNHGAGYARQLGIIKTYNPYIFFIDADDELIKNDAIELLFNEIVKENSVLAMGHESHKNKTLIHEGHIYAKLYSRKFIEEYKIKIPNYPREEDVAFTMAFLCLAPKEKIKKIDKAVYKYCNYNKNSITKKISIDNGYDFKYLFKAIDYAYKYAKKYKSFKYFNTRIYQIFLGLSLSYINDFMHTNLEKREKYLRNCKHFITKYDRYFKGIEKTGYNRYEESDYNAILYFINILKNI